MTQIQFKDLTTLLNQRKLAKELHGTLFFLT